MNATDPRWTGRLERAGGYLRYGDGRYKLQREGRTVFAMLDNSTYQGDITHDPATNTIAGHLVDGFGFGFRISGTHRDGGYDLAVTVSIPDEFKVPFLDSGAA